MRKTRRANKPKIKVIAPSERFKPVLTPRGKGVRVGGSFWAALRRMVVL